MADILLGHSDFKRVICFLCIGKWSSFPVLQFIQYLDGEKNNYIEENLYFPKVPDIKFGNFSMGAYFIFRFEEIDISLCSSVIGSS